MTPLVTIVADDLTGAADTGVTFAAQGAATLVVWGEGPLPEDKDAATPSVAVLSTESRQVDPHEAVRRVSRVAERLRSGTPGSDRPWIYKKIDSTLRGHPGRELAALARALEMPGALVAPAFPAQGRTTLGSLQLVDGVPLTGTVFGREVASSDIRRLLADAFPEERIRALPLKRVREGIAAVSEDLALHPTAVWVADAETDPDLAILVRAAAESGIRLLCGSAGLAQALAGMLAGIYGWKPKAWGMTLGMTLGLALGSFQGRGVLVVAASRHPQTLAQIAAAGAAGIPVIRPEPAWFTARAEVGSVTADLVAGLERGAAILTTAGLPDGVFDGSALAARLGEAVAALVSQHRPAGLVLTGGDAAIAVSAALQAQGIRLHGEVASGVPWGTLVGGSAPGIPVVTKAGGFGGEDTLLTAIQFLNQEYLNQNER